MISMNFTKAGGYIRLLNPELGDDVCIIEDSDFLDTDKTFADISLIWNI